ncbi:hypothetical protein IWX49DRAFT_589293 [Phyllosticta citricarpa]|uniref:Nephrocystin 3-like N-terminal domain-containing protein n=2 Tax=Phyllosticta TaxID=121621 RepID=A0ABR1MDB4_9PEZI
MWPWRRKPEVEVSDGDIPYVKEEGIVVLHDDGPGAIADVCFQLLPNTLSQRGVKIRVLSFGHDARPVKWEGGSGHGRVFGYSRSLMQELADYREDLGAEICDRPILKDLSESFDNVAGQIEKYCCYETGSTSIAGVDIGLIVSETSATMNGAKLAAISEDHTNMCKFNSEQDPNYRAVYESITEAKSKTFQWLMDPSENQQSKFINFLRADDTLFWISGEPGAGKSTLMKFLYDHPALRTYLYSWSSREVYATASFYFLRRGEDLQKSLEGLLRSLLYQLVEQVPEFAPIVLHYQNLSGPWQLKRSNVLSLIA